MVAEINLLPKEKEVDKSALKAVSVLNKIALGLTVVFLIITAVGGGIYFFMTQRLNTLREEQQSYTSNIQSLQSTEASLILLKDRIQKAQNILSSRTNEEIFRRQQAVLAGESPDIIFDSSRLENLESDIAITSTQSSALSAFINNLLSRGNITSLIMEEFAFIPGQGYEVSFKFQ